MICVSHMCATNPIPPFFSEWNHVHVWCCGCFCFIFTHNIRTVKPNILLENSHVWKNVWNTKLVPPHPSLCLCMPLTFWYFWPHHPVLYSWKGPWPFGIATLNHPGRPGSETWFSHKARQKTECLIWVSDAGWPGWLQVSIPISQRLFYYYREG